MLSTSLRRLVTTAAPRFRSAACLSAAPHCTRTAVSSTVLSPCRFFSSNDDVSSAPQVTPRPPSTMNDDIALGIQDATALYINYGLGKVRLEQIAKLTDTPLVTKWQYMMEAFIGTQVHVLAGLGYSPDEQGLQFYNQQLGMYIQSASPELQEELRIKGRNTWRAVLTTAFNIQPPKEELSIVDARNMMHKVSLKMASPEILESLRDKVALIKPSDNPQMDMARRHQVVQEVLVHEVHLSGLTEECGFAAGDEGYVEMQCAMAEHQSDPLVAQYMGASMLKVMEAAGLDLASVQKAAGGASPPE